MLAQKDFPNRGKIVELELVDLGASRLDDETNDCLIQASVPITDDPNDKASYGDVQTISGLGVTARPYPETPEGKADGVIVSDIGNTDGVLVGARDTRCSKVYGALEPGDTALHACDPNASSQVVCYGSDKEGNKVLAITKDTAGDNLVLVLDGKNDAIQISGLGLHFEMSKENGILMTDGGASILIKDGQINLIGSIVFGSGGAASASVLCADPVTLQTLNTALVGIGAPPNALKAVPLSGVVTFP